MSKNGRPFMADNCQAADTVYLITYLDVWQEEFLAVTGELDEEEK
jgi:hypothetical protein